MKPTDSSAGVVWALPTTNSPARSTTKVSVIVPPASIASTRGSRPFAPSGGTTAPLHRRLLYDLRAYRKTVRPFSFGWGSTDTGRGPCPYDLRDGGEYSRLRRIHGRPGGSFDRDRAGSARRHGACLAPRGSRRGPRAGAARTTWRRCIRLRGARHGRDRAPPAAAGRRGRPRGGGDPRENSGGYHRGA